MHCRFVRFGISLFLFFVITHCDAQEYHPHQFFIKVKTPSSLQVTAQGQSTFLDASLASKAALWNVVNVQPLVNQNQHSLRKGSSELSHILIVTFDSSYAIDQVMKDFSSDPNVEYVEYNHIFRLDFVPNDSAYSQQWGMQRVGMEKAWDMTKGSPSVIIGVIDTGIDYKHADLKSQLWINLQEDINHDGFFEPWLSTEIRNGISGDLDGIDNDGNGYTDDVIGFNFVDQSNLSKTQPGSHNIPGPDPLDDFGHGTSVSGIIGAATNNGIGIAGIAPDCKIMPLRAFDENGIGIESDVARALAYAIDQGVSVVNMSFGDKTFSRVLRDVIQYAYKAGVTMIASSGNSTSDELHYPSAYDETISVGATGQSDGLASFSNFGESMDLVAPGISIVTCDRENRYTSFNGTSASAPFVTGAAALIKSFHPQFTPEEVRGILVASVDNISGHGWDHYTAAGRLNIYKALLMDQPTVVRITSPKTDYTTGEPSIVITGTAASPLMNAFSLQYGVGLKPADWIDIIPKSRRQIVAETLAVWNIASLPDSDYVIRLSAESNKGVTIEDRVVITISHNPPRFLAAGIIPTIDAESYGVGAGFQTDQPTLGKIWYRKKGLGESWKWISAEGSTTNNLFIGTVHSAFIGKQYLDPGFEYEFYFSAVNKAGLESILNNKGQNYPAIIGNPISSSGFIRKPYNLPLSRLCPVTTDFDNNGYREVLTNDLTDQSKFKILEFRNTQFVNVTPPNMMDKIPRAAGDAKGNGKQELLSSIVRHGILYESPAANSFPQNIIWADTTSKNDFWPCAIADVNDDGKQEIIAITSDTTIGIFTFNASNQMQQIASLVNPTSPPPNGKNSFGSPKVAIGDFNGNGRTEMLFGDEDGDFFIYETRGGNQFEVTWISENDFEHASDFVAAGDFDGDGKKEFAIGFRTSTDDIIPFWYVTIRKLDATNKSKSLWEQAFYGVEDNAQFGLFSRIQNSLTAGNIDNDPADELIITTFPEMYVIKYDKTSQLFSPIFYRPLVNTNSAVIADFDKNGINEIAFATADSVVFLEKDIAYNGPPIPVSLSIQYQDSKSIRLSWVSSGQVSEFNLYKGSSIADLKFFGRLGSNGATDFSLEEGKTYLYAISSYDSTRALKESPLVYSRILHTHASGLIDSMSYLQTGQFELHVSQDMGTMIPSITSFRLNDILNPQSVVLLSQRKILLTFNNIADGNYTITLNDLRDAEGIPFTAAQQPVVTVRNSVVQSFYILRSEYIPDGKMDLYFNMDLDSASAQNILNYTFSPTGKVIKATVDPQNKKLVHLTLSSQQPIGALGKEYQIKVTNVKSVDGKNIVSGAGSTAGIIINKENLDNIFVYPNPYHETDGVDYIMFANITPRAAIRIYTLSGLFVNEVQETDGNGGVEWNMTDQSGNKVPAGMYIFYATGKNSAGADVDPKKGKFAIIR